MKFLSFLCTKWMGNLWGDVHHQLAHLHIHTNWSRNVSWKFAKLQSVITFLFFNRFSSGFHCFIHKLVTLSYEIKLNLFRISPLTTRCYSSHICFTNVSPMNDGLRIITNRRSWKIFMRLLKTPNQFQSWYAMFLQIMPCFIMYALRCYQGTFSIPHQDFSE